MGIFRGINAKEKGIKVEYSFKKGIKGPLIASFLVIHFQKNSLPSPPHLCTPGKK